MPRLGLLDCRVALRDGHVAPQERVDLLRAPTGAANLPDVVEHLPRHRPGLERADCRNRP
jgi:hypothetical protein